MAGIAERGIFPPLVFVNTFVTMISFVSLLDLVKKSTFYFLSIIALFFAMHITSVSAASGFEAQSVVSGLTIPTALAFVPDGRIFIAEK
jgi:hypothetical protein